MAGIDHAPPFFKRGPAPLAPADFYVAAFPSPLRGGPALQEPRPRPPERRPGRRPGAAGGPDAGQPGRYRPGLPRGLHSLRAENAQLKHAQLNSAPDLQRLQQLEAENDRLRRLLTVRSEKAKGQVAQILYTARDPFSRRIVVDKGQQHAVTAGQPAIDETGWWGR